MGIEPTLVASSTRSFSCSLVGNARRFPRVSIARGTIPPDLGQGNPFDPRRSMVTVINVVNNGNSNHRADDRSAIIEIDSAISVSDIFISRKTDEVILKVTIEEITTAPSVR